MRRALEGARMLGLGLVVDCGFSARLIHGQLITFAFSQDEARSKAIP